MGRWVRCRVLLSHQSVHAPVVIEQVCAVRQSARDRDEGYGTGNME